MLLRKSGFDAYHWLGLSVAESPVTVLNSLGMEFTSPLMIFPPRDCVYTCVPSLLVVAAQSAWPIYRELGLLDVLRCFNSAMG